MKLQHEKSPGTCSWVHDCRGAYGEVGGVLIEGEIWTSVSVDFRCASVVMFSLLILKAMKKGLWVTIVLGFFNVTFKKCWSKQNKKGYFVWVLIKRLIGSVFRLVPLLVTLGAGLNWLTSCFLTHKAQYVWITFFCNCISFYWLNFSLQVNKGSTNSFVFFGNLILFLSPACFPILG